MASDLQKKAIYFVIFVGLIVLILSSLPVFESWLQTAVLPEIGLVFSKGWTLTEASAGQPMNVTYAAALDAFFRIITIILWMAAVIAVVRFLAFLILRTAYRTSAQPEVFSLLKTVSSMVIYIIAFFIIFQTQYPGVPLSPCLQDQRSWELLWVWLCRKH